MLEGKKIGNINSFTINDRPIDLLQLDWYETKKRIIRKQTVKGKDISLKLLNDGSGLTEGDILFADETCIIAVSVLPAECIVLEPKNMFEMASACYEIGNKHLPLFYENDQLLVPFELPLFNMLKSLGYEIKKDRRKLLQPLKTTVAAHAEPGSETLFSKIMKLTSCL
jgi:urease accessory protein